MHGMSVQSSKCLGQGRQGGMVVGMHVQDYEG